MPPKQITNTSNTPMTISLADPVTGIITWKFTLLPGESVVPPYEPLVRVNGQLLDKPKP